MKQGNIPEKLTFFVRNPIKVSFHWDDVEEGEEMTNVNKEEVLPCYISDSKNKKTLESGRSWAENDYYYENNKRKTRGIFHTFEVDNQPFTNVRIMTLEIRDQGGRAYKVCADFGPLSNLYFDLREDVLLDCMIHCGISKGALLTDNFIFAKIGASMKIIRVGSLLHMKMIDATDMKNAKPIEDLEIGGLYRNKAGDENVFMGKYWIKEPVLEEYTDNSGVGWNVRTVKKFKLKNYGKSYEVYVFHSPHMDYKTNEVEWFEKTGNTWRKKGEPLSFGFNLVKSHSYKEKVKNVEIPDGFVEKFIQWNNSRGLEYHGSGEKSVKEFYKINSLSKEKPDTK